MSAIAIDLGGTNVRAARVEADGTIAHRASAPTPQTGVLDVVVELAEQCRTAEVTGAGIGFPGFLALPEGRVITAPNLTGWDGVPLKQTLEERLGLPVHCENDANAAALGEQTFGAARGCRDFVQLTLGTGLGSGFVLGGAIYHGATGMAGELGHIPVDVSETAFACGCGRKGCLETLVSKKGFQNLASATWSPGDALYESSGGDPTKIDLAHAAKLSDAHTRATFETLGRWLGIGLATVANALNLEKAVLGGGVANAWGRFIDATNRELAARAISDLEVVRSELGDDAGLLGAASLPLHGRG